MTAGRRDTLVTLQRATLTQDTAGEADLAWSSIGKEWSQVFWGRGDERRQAAMEKSFQPATFRMLDNSLTRSLTTADRIVASGRAYDIKGVAQFGNGEIEVTTVASSGADL